MIRTHFEHDYGEVEAIVNQEFESLRPRDRKYIADVVFAYGNTHRNGAAYRDFKRVVSCALPSGVKDSSVRPVYTQLFDYTPKGEKKPKANNVHNNHDPRVQPRVRDTLVSRTYEKAKPSLSRER